MDHIREDLKEIKADLKELVKQGAVHNALLKEHEARSLALQAQVKEERAARSLLAERLQPVEAHVKFFSSALKWGGTILAALIVQAIVRHLL